MTSIDAFAFSSCKNLRSVELPASLTSLGTDAFYACGALTAIVADADNGAYTSADGVLFSKDRTVLILCPEGKSGSYSIPWTVTEIGYEAFHRCRWLTEVTIPYSVRTIGAYAFSECGGLTGIEIPSTVTDIGPYAFYSCTLLRNVTIPYGVTAIEEGTFGYCWYLETVTIPSGVTVIEEGMFGYCWYLETVTIPYTVTGIGDSAFSECNHLSHVLYEGPRSRWDTIAIGDGNDSLTEAALHCDLVPDVWLPRDLKEIEEEAFRGGAFICVILPEETEIIGRNAFADCPNLAYIYIPENTTVIDALAFGERDELIVFGRAGSAAESYAEDHGFIFIEGFPGT